MKVRGSPGRWLLIIAVLLALFPPAPVIAGDWEQFHRGLNRAFAESAGHQEPNLLLTALVVLLLVLAVAGAGWLWSLKRRASGYSPTPVTRNPAATVRPYRGTGSQRRSWVRVPADGLNLYYALVRPDKKLVYKKARVLDISGGGFMFATNDELKINDELKVIVELSANRQITAGGRVARVVTSRRGDNQQLLVGVEFRGIREGARDSLVRWIFKRQQRLLRRRNQMPEGTCLRCGKPLPENQRAALAYCSHCLEKGDMGETPSE